MDEVKWYRRLRAEPSLPVRAMIGTGTLIAVFFVWWLVTRGDDPWVSPNKLVRPSEALGSLGHIDNLSDHIIASLQRVVLGVGLAAIIGITLGVIASAQRGVAAALAPIVIFLRSVPLGALLPLTLLLFGALGEGPKWKFLFLAVVPFVFSDTVKAVSIVPERYVETAQTLGASRLQIVLKVLVPLSLPDIITSLRFQIGLALGYITLAEASVDVKDGIGAVISNDQRMGHTPDVLGLVIIIAILAFGIDLMLRTLQRGIFQWRKDL